MKKFIVISLFLLWLCGCDSIRFAPSEIQKQNAYLHNRVTKIAADTAKDEYASQKLQALTDLSHLQSKSYTTYFGLPKELPDAESAEDVLAQSNYAIAQTSLEQSAERPDPFETADALLELAIGISAVVGGVYGTKAVRFLKEARAKSQALKEVVQGNELFKIQNPDSKETFKQAQSAQSSETKKLVTELKT
ncbi:MAG: hypothetical protein JW804_08710 [Sedimentisphaerales bacterium]|nr:hypothetical protein [Sedimentisphaerales bacterium]